MKEIFIFFNLFLFFICEQNNLLDWGLKNNLNISDCIETSKPKKNKIIFKSKEDIPKNSDLLIIPSKLMFNLSKALELINSTSLNKQRKEFQNLELSYKPNEIDTRKEESFLSYIIYLTKHNLKKYKKTKFFQFFENFLQVLQKYYPKSPLFYPTNQVQYLAGTFLDRCLDELRQTYQDEIDKFLNKEIYKKPLEFDEYAHYRLAIKKYGMKILNQWTMVPFLNYFHDDFESYNAKYSIEKNGDLRIFSTKDIKKDEEIILKCKKMTNIESLLKEGKTKEKLVDYFTEYSITAFSPGLYYQFGIPDRQYFLDYYVNILDSDSQSKFVKIYKDHADMLHGDGADVWAYDIMEINVNFYKEHFESITLDKIYDIYYDSDDRINIERIIRGERKMIENYYVEINKVGDKLAEEERKEKKKRKQSEEL